MPADTVEQLSPHAIRQIVEALLKATSDREQQVWRGQDPKKVQRQRFTNKTVVDPIKDYITSEVGSLDDSSTTLQDSLDEQFKKLRGWVTTSTQKFEKLQAGFKSKNSEFWKIFDSRSEFTLSNIVKFKFREEAGFLTARWDLFAKRTKLEDLVKRGVIAADPKSQAQYLGDIFKNSDLLKTLFISDRGLGSQSGIDKLREGYEKLSENNQKTLANFAKSSGLFKINPDGTVAFTGQDMRLFLIQSHKILNTLPNPTIESIKSIIENMEAETVKLSDEIIKKAEDLAANENKENSFAEKLVLYMSPSISMLQEMSSQIFDGITSIGSHLKLDFRDIEASFTTSMIVFKRQTSKISLQMKENIQKRVENLYSEFRTNAKTEHLTKLELLTGQKYTTETTTKIHESMSIIQNQIESINDNIDDIRNDSGGMFGDWFKLNTLGILFKTITLPVTAIYKTLKLGISSILWTIKTLVIKPLKWIFTQIKNFGSWLWKGFTNILSKFNPWDSFADFLLSPAGVSLMIFLGVFLKNQLFPWIKSHLSVRIDQIVQSGKDWIKQILSDAGIFEPLKKMFEPILKWFESMSGSTWQETLTNIAKWVKDIWDWIFTKFQQLFNPDKLPLNELLDQRINDIKSIVEETRHMAVLISQNVQLLVNAAKLVKDETRMIHKTEKWMREGIISHWWDAYKRSSERGDGIFGTWKAKKELAKERMEMLKPIYDGMNESALNIVKNLDNISTEKSIHGQADAATLRREEKQRIIKLQKAQEDVLDISKALDKDFNDFSKIHIKSVNPAEFEGLGIDEFMSKATAQLDEQDAVITKLEERLSQAYDKNATGVVDQYQDVLKEVKGIRNDIQQMISERQHNTFIIPQSKQPTLSPNSVQ